MDLSYMDLHDFKNKSSQSMVTLPKASPHIFRPTSPLLGPTNMSKKINKRNKIGSQINPNVNQSVDFKNTLINSSSHKFQDRPQNISLIMAGEHQQKLNVNSPLENECNPLSSVKIDLSQNAFNSIGKYSSVSPVKHRTNIIGSARNGCYMPFGSNSKTQTNTNIKASSNSPTKLGSSSNKI